MCLHILMLKSDKISGVFKFVTGFFWCCAGIWENPENPPFYEKADFEIVVIV